uniref:Uncharacterized protein n=1 Tax=viral metagenome TaxID=1070528 RepID=A0A6M3JRZ0_9ZZZZ
MDKPIFDTVQEFETWYANNSGDTIADLHNEGRYGAPCDCGDEECTGWQMTHEAGVYNTNTICICAEAWVEAGE